MPAISIDLTVSKSKPLTIKVEATESGDYKPVPAGRTFTELDSFQQCLESISPGLSKRFNVRPDVTGYYSELVTIEDASQEALLAAGLIL